MVFSSYLFVFGFLPAFLTIYYLLRPKFRNAFILLASLFFYYVGDKNGIIALVGAIVLNYVVGFAIGAAPEPGGEGGRSRRWRSTWLTVGLVLNLSVLIWFKYVGLVTRTTDELARLIGATSPVPIIQAALPLGISFFVFQGMSYLIDVYRGTIAPTRNIIVFGAYKAMFPQLIAGPIVRYRDIAEALKHRAIDESMVVVGITRFVIGYGKKVLLADTFAVTADAVFALPVDQLSTATAWLGTLAYTLQIYFDFSAYSDMAIGMALMMGFRFPENFNYPYVSRSIREFWRRWHMTLSGWFRDYVYIPLGGSRAGRYRTYLNSVIVFGLTGLWHGAAWTFVVWGMWHGLFIVLERALDLDRRRIPSVLRWAGTMGVVLVGWVLFRAESFSHATAILLRMAGASPPAGAARPFGEFWNPWLAVTMGLALVLSMPVYQWAKARMSPGQRVAAGAVLFPIVFLLASAKVLAGAYSPFLYFRF